MRNLQEKYQIKKLKTYPPKRRLNAYEKFIDRCGERGNLSIKSNFCQHNKNFYLNDSIILANAI